MAIRARAEATREKIIASSVDLFSRLGYGETGLSDVIDHAGVSKGAFYYHFESKEALAGAIIQAGTGQLLDLFKAITGAQSPALQNTIAATFAIAKLTGENTMVRTANQLRQCLSQVSAAGSPTYRPTVDAFRMQVDKAIAEAMWKATAIPTTSLKRSVSASSRICCPTPWVTFCSPGSPGRGASCCVAACRIPHGAISTTSSTGPSLQHLRSGERRPQEAFQVVG